MGRSLGLALGRLKTMLSLVKDNAVLVKAGSHMNLVAWRRNGGDRDGCGHL